MQSTMHHAEHPETMQSSMTGRPELQDHTSSGKMGRQTQPPNARGSAQVVGQPWLLRVVTHRELSGECSSQKIPHNLQGHSGKTGRVLIARQIGNTYANCVRAACTAGPSNSRCCRATFVVHRLVHALHTAVPASHTPLELLHAIKVLLVATQLELGSMHQT